MATKNFLDLSGLQSYDNLLKQYIGTEDAKSIKSITVVGNTVNFFKNESASGQPSYTVDLPDVSGFMELIDNAEGGKLAVTAADGSVTESDIAITEESGTVGVLKGTANTSGYDGLLAVWTGYHELSDRDSEDNQVYISNLITAISATQGNVIIADSNGKIDDSGWGIGEAGNGGIMTGYVANVDSASGYLIVSADPDDDYDITGASVKVEDLITGYAGNYNYGYITYAAEGGLATTTTSLEEFNDVIAATTGFDADNTIADFIGSIPQGSSATSIVGYIDEVAGDLGDEVDAKSVYIVDNGSTSAYAKVYSIYQGTGSAQSPVVGEKLIDINIPKDQVVEDGSVVDITFHDSKLWDGNTDVTELIKGSGTPTAADAGKYIKLELQNVADPLYIAAQSLVDTYTAASGATQVQLAISNANEISATLVAGGVGTTELAAGAVTTAKIDNGAVTGTKIANGAVDTAQIADDAVTAAKVSIAAHSETQTASTDGLAISVTTTDGQVSAVSGSIAANTYDSYGSASAAQTAAEGYTDSAIAGLDATVSIEDSGNTNPLNITITQTDGELVSVTGSIDANTFDSYGSAATAESNANTYTDNATAAISTSAIEALFE